MKLISRLLIFSLEHHPQHSIMLKSQSEWVRLDKGRRRKKDLKKVVEATGI